MAVRPKPYSLDWPRAASLDDVNAALSKIIPESDEMFQNLFQDAALNAGVTALKSLSDVSIPTPSDQQILTYQASSGLWIAQSPAAQGGGALASITAPVDANYSWANQGGASVNATAGKCIYLLAPATSGNNLRMRVLAQPATPYTLTVAVIPNIIDVNFCSAGLVWRDSVSGKVITFGYGGATHGLSDSKFNSPTSFSATYASLAITLAGQYLWMQMSDNGTNRICRFGFDGINYRTLHTVGNTDFLTANQIGFYADPNQTTADSAITLVSWLTTSP